MTDMDWLMYANIAVWIACAYLFLLRNQIAQPPPTQQTAQ